MAYLDLHNVGGHISFMRMIKMAILKKANEVAQEVESPLSEKRRALAAQIFANTDQQAKQFSFHIASQGGNAITVSESGELVHTLPDIDTALDNIVDDIFDIRAGITPEELA